MLQTLKSYDSAVAEGLLAKTSFYLEGSPVPGSLRGVEDEAALRNALIKEICKILKIDSAEEDKQAVLDFIDGELEKRMALSKKEEKAILTKLSNEARLPTDLYNVIWKRGMPEIFTPFVDSSLVKETVKMPDMVYNFNTDSPEDVQKDISIFARRFPAPQVYRNFFMIVTGRRSGLNFIASQAWKMHDNITADHAFSNALDMLELFAGKFGAEAEFRGEVTKFFLSRIADDEKEFHIRTAGRNLQDPKKGRTEFPAFYFAEKVSGTGQRFSLFFALDKRKYHDYLKTYTQRT
jgi:hypothetical protein